MGKKTLFHVKPKWLLLCLSFFACALGVMGGIVSSAAEAVGVQAAATTATYTITSASAVSTSGTAPAGSSATFSNTYTNNKVQITKDNSMTLTLTGYAGTTISGITLSMHSNSKSGSGNYNMTIGTTTVSSIATNSFSDAAWHGSWSESFVDVSPTVTSTVVGTGQSVVVTIAATANSLYCQSFTIAYAPAAPAGTYSVTYDGNGSTGGSAPTDGTAYASGATVTVEGANTLVKRGWLFSCWNTQDDGEGTSYNPGETFTIAANTTLYAIWEDDPDALDSNAGTYQLVTSTASLGVGDFVLLTSGKTGSVNALSGISTTSTKYGKYTGVTASKNLIVLEGTEKIEVFRIVEGSTSGKLSFFGQGLVTGVDSLTTVSDYLYWGSGNSLNHNASKSANTSWSISIDAETSGATIANSSDNNRLIKFNSDRFACYTTDTGVFPYLFKKINAVTSFTVKTAPTKTAYEKGDDFDPAGLVITATYENGTTADIDYDTHASDFEFTPSAFSTAGNQNVTIGYGNKEATQAVTVATMASLTITGSARADRNGTWDFSNLVVTGTLSSGASAGNITSKCVFSSNATTSDASLTSIAVHIVYTNGEAVTEFNETVNAVINDSIYDDISKAFAGLGNSYAAWDKTSGVTEVRYVGFASGNSSGLMTINNTHASGSSVGFVSTVSGGRIESVSIDWGSADNVSGRYIDVYAKNTPYAAVSELHDVETQGTLIGSFDTAKETLSFNVTDPHAYIGIRSRSGAISFASIRIVWDTVPGVSLSANSVEGFAGSTDDTIDLHILNFTPISFSVAYSTDDMATVSGIWDGTNKKYDLTVTFIAKTTDPITATITIGGSRLGNLTAVLTIRIDASLTSIRIYNGQAVDNHLEIERGSFRQFTVYGSDGATETALPTSAFTLTVDNTSSFNVSSSRVYGIALGDGVVTARHNTFTSLTSSMDISCLDDYGAGTLNEISFNLGLTALEGGHPDASEIFATRLENTHFGHTMEIPDSSFRYSYDNVGYESALPAEEFAFDFSKGSVVDDTHKSQTVHVYCAEVSWNGSFTITVQRILVTSLLIDGVEYEDGDDYELDLPRNGSHLFEVEALPDNATVTGAVSYTLDSYDEGVNLSLDGARLSDSNSDFDGGAIIVISASAPSTVSVNVFVTIVAEELTLDVLPRYFEKVTSTDDIVSGDYLIVYEGGGVAFDGGLEMLDATSNTIDVIISEGRIEADADTKAAAFTIDASEGTIKSKSGLYIGRTADSNGMDASEETEYTNTLSIDNEYNANIVGSGGAYLRYNSASNQNRFRYYKSSSYTLQQAIQLYHLPSGSTEVATTMKMQKAVMAAEDEIACHESGIGSITSWADVKKAFDDQSLSDTEKEYFACAVAREDGNYIEQFLARYDYIVGKYSSGAYTIEDLDGNKQTITDFLDRDPPDPSAALGNYRPYVQSESPLTMTLWIVLGSGLLGLGAIGAAYWVSKRKKHRA